jgi:hypothetical protein
MSVGSHEASSCIAYSCSGHLEAGCQGNKRRDALGLHFESILIESLSGCWCCCFRLEYTLSYASSYKRRASEYVNVDEFILRNEMLRAKKRMTLALKKGRLQADKRKKRPGEDEEEKDNS